MTATPSTITPPDRSGADVILVLAYLLGVAYPIFELPITLLISLVCCFTAVALRSQRRLTLDTALVFGVVVAIVVPSRFVIGPLGFSASLLVGLTALLLWVVKWFTADSQHRFGSAKTDALVIGFVAVMLASQIWGFLRPLPGTELPAANRRVLELLAYAGIALFTADALRSRAALESAFTALTAAAGVAAFIGLLQWATGHDVTTALQLPGLAENPAATEALADIYLRGDFQRITGSTLHPIELGTLLAVTFPICIHLLGSGRRTAQRLIGASTLWLSMLAIPLTISRAAILGVGVAILALLPFSSWRTRMILVGSTVIAALVAALAFPNVTRLLGELITDPNSDGGSVASRAEDYHRIFTYVTERPLLGRGFGSFVPTQYFWVDNQYLRTLVETGLVGLIALVSLLGGTMLIALGVRRRATSRTDRSMAQTLFASVAAATIVSGTFDALSFPMFSVVLFLVIGMTGALGRLVSDEHRSTPAQQRPAIRTTQQDLEPAA